MLRKIIQIDEEKCNGCGACAAACHEGAIAMVDGKAKLIREDYCDGLGDCLPACRQMRFLLKSERRLHTIVSVDLIKFRGLLITQPFLHHSFHNFLLELWCIPFVCYSFWHNITPHSLDSM